MFGWCSFHTQHPKRARLRVSDPTGWGAPSPLVWLAGSLVRFSWSGPGAAASPPAARKEGGARGLIGSGASRREQGPCNHAPLCSGASSAVSGREPGRQVKRDEGAAWSGILAHAHPRAYTAPPGRPSSPNQFSWVPKTPFSTRCGQSLRPEELAPQWREVVPYPKSWNWDAQSWLEQVGLIAVGKLLRNFTLDLTMQCHR